MDTAETLSPPHRDVGAQLAAARQSAGLSISDIAQRIKLSNRQIEALEQGRFEQMGLVFTRGFIRSYARVVGLDADTLIARLPAIQPARTDSLNIHDEHIPLKADLPQLWMLLVSIVMIIIIASTWLAYRWLSTGATDQPTSQHTVVDAHHRRLPSTVGAPPIKPVVALTTLSSNNTESAGSTPVATFFSSADTNNAQIDAALVPHPTTPAAHVKTLHLQLGFNQDSWLQIHDGQQQKITSKLYHAGEHVEFTVQAPASLIIGNAAHVSLTNNDQPIAITPTPPATVTRLTLP